jgi:hypothetical protein
MFLSTARTIVFHLSVSATCDEGGLNKSFIVFLALYIFVFVREINVKGGGQLVQSIECRDCGFQWRDMDII